MPAITVERKVESYYTTGTKALVYRVILTPMPVAAPGWQWPASLPSYSGEGDTVDKADKAAMTAMQDALG